MKHLDLEVQRELGTIVVESKVDWVEFSTSAIIFLPLLYQMIFESVKVEDLIEIGFLLSLFIILLFVAPSLWIPPFSEIPSLKKIVIAEHGILTRRVFLPRKREVYLFKEFDTVYDTVEIKSFWIRTYRENALWLTKDKYLILRIPDCYSNYEEMRSVSASKVRLSNLHIEYDKKNKIGKREFVARHMLYS